MKKIIFKQPALEFLTICDMTSRHTILNEEEDELRRILYEDFPELTNENEQLIVTRVKRYKKIVDELKEKYHNQCQMCGFTFEKENGNCYSEAHHIVRLADNGSQNENNVLILCANHHRMLHYAKRVDYDIENEQIRGIRVNDEYYVLRH